MPYVPLTKHKQILTAIVHKRKKNTKKSKNQQHGTNRVLNKRISQKWKFSYFRRRLPSVTCFSVSTPPTHLPRPSHPTLVSLFRIFIIFFSYFYLTLRFFLFLDFICNYFLLVFFLFRRSFCVLNHSCFLFPFPPFKSYFFFALFFSLCFRYVSFYR